MNIALMHYAAPPVVGGVETVMARQARLLARAGHAVRILAGRGQTWDERIPVEVLPHLDSLDATVLHLKSSLDAGQVPADFSPFVRQIEADLRRALAGVEVVIAHNVASLHKNMALTAALYNLSQSGPSPRLILWHHDLAWNAERYQAELHNGWPWDLLCTAWPGARQVTISEARRQELAGLLGIAPQEIAVIPAGLDTADFFGLDARSVDLMEKLSLERASPVLLAPVRITRRKNLELAIAAVAHLRRRMPEARLVITGPPGAHNPSNLQYLESLQNLRSTLGLEGAVHLLAEYVPQGLPDVVMADFYRLSDALILPSREEGFGIPILEAGLSRLPIFCSDLSPLRALAGDWAVYFAPDAEPQQVARLIEERLRPDPAYQLRCRVRQNYTWEAIYEDRIAPLLEKE